MRRIQNTSPEWLVRWLSLPFYVGKCDKHVHRYNTIFCGVCMGKPVCETCWKDISRDHEDHQRLQVRIASRRTAIEIEDIKKVFDVSYIQQYKANQKDIVYLCPNLGGAVEKNNNPKCEMCKRKLIHCKYKFCSISCKNESIECGMQTEKNVNTESKRAECCSMRKRRRKGTPQRAPLK